MARQTIERLSRRARSARRYLRAANLPVRSIFRRLGEVDVILLASAIAFSGLLTLIPILIIFASIAGIILSSSDLGVQQVSTILDAIFPPQPFALDIKNSLAQIVLDIIKYRTSLGIVGFVALMVTATFLFDILRTALHRIYGLKRRRNLLVSFFHDLGFVLLAFCLLVITNLAIWALSFLHTIFNELPGLRSVFIPEFNETFPTGVIVVMTAIMFYVVYGHLTDVKPPTAAAVASTLTMTVLWVISGKLFSIYLRSYSVIGSLYGPYTFLLVLLLWIYYSSVVFVLGGIVGQIYWETLKGREAAGRKQARDLRHGETSD